MGMGIGADQFLIIIGSAKSGTTSLFNYLGQHPAVCPSVPKEPAFFSRYREPGMHARRYEDFWPQFNPEAHRYALEGSVVYTMWPEGNGVATRMHAYGIRPRMIYLVRDPIERIESQVNFRRIYSRQRIGFDDSHPVDASRYAAQLDPFAATFGRESLRVVDFANLRADPNGVCAEIFNWLGLPQHAIDKPAVHNATARLVRSQLDRALAASPGLRRAGRTLPPVARRLARKAALQLVPYRHQQVRIPPGRVREIRTLLHADIDRLGREWDVDVTRWGFGPSDPSSGRPQ